MTSYIIAGSSDRKELTICENIARQIKSVYTNIEFNMILKHPSEWDEAIKIICKHYGLKKASNPIIFAKTGRPVGGVDEFIKLAEQKFGIDVKNLANAVDPSVNQKIAQKDYEERHRERTLAEQIEDKYKTLLEQNKLTKLPGFYESKFDKGIEYFVKETDSTAPKIDVPLTVKHDYQKEKPFEDFMADFCEGMVKITNEEGDRTQSAGPDGGSGRPASGTKQPEKQATTTLPPVIEEEKEKEKIAAPPQEHVAEVKPEGEHHLEEHKAEENQPEIKLEGQENQDVPLENSREQATGQELEGESPRVGETSMLGAAMAASELAKVMSGQAFTLTVLNEYVVRELGDDYYLSFHPQPLYEGQCIVFNNTYSKYKEAAGIQEGEEEGEEKVALYDYSLHGRKDTGKDYTEKSAKNRLKNESSKSFLNKKEISIYEPLSCLDWTYIYKIVKETDSVAFLQLLPHGKKNYRHLSNGIVSIILRQFLLKEHQNLGIQHPNADQETKLPFEKIIEKGVEVYSESQPEDFITLADLPFNHKMAIIQDSCDGLQFKRTYFEMMQRLNEIYGEELDNFGINVILSSKWLLVIPITGPFATQKDVPVYLDSLIYLGYIVIPDLKKILPPHEKVSEDRKLPGQILANFLPKK